MFASLDEQIKQDEVRAATPRERMAKWIGIGLTAVAVFGGLYLAIQFFA